MITILGPTATGKTRLAALVADAIGGEIISADSRQVYRQMDIGTGKDYKDYTVNGKIIPTHLVDIVEPGTEYNVFEFKKAALQAIHDIERRGKVPLICGGSGMYIESLVGDYKLIVVPENLTLRDKLKNKTHNELVEILLAYGHTHNVTDLEIPERLIKAIEIKEYYQRMNIIEHEKPVENCLIFGIDFPRLEVRNRITERLKARLNSGMIDEVKQLIDKGVPREMLILYGLEYRWITRYLGEEITYQTMYEKLNTSIHQFAKRQIIWFRRMEKKGYHIHWIDGHLPDNEKVKKILDIIKKATL
ncbi:MAG: tRNA (adenosine(37)-N6)-dimethylallyltransferase MiaA [Bacteroidota bacterium]